MKTILNFLKSILRSRIFQVSAALFFSFWLYIGGTYLSGNFREVIPNEFYRSGQLKKGDIAEMSNNYGIKTILNLRGENTGSAWYDNEVADAKASNVKHINFKMSSKRELTSDQIKELITIMRDAPKPLLVHCEGGVDRSGLASALYMFAIKNSEGWEAAKHLTLLYGRPLYLGTDKMRLTFEAAKTLKPWLEMDMAEGN